MVALFDPLSSFTQVASSDGSAHPADLHGVNKAAGGGLEFLDLSGKEPSFADEFGLGAAGMKAGGRSLETRAPEPSRELQHAAQP